MEHRYVEDNSFQKALREFLQGIYNSDKVHLDDTSPFYSIPGGDIPLRYGYSDGKYVFYS
jgi:hypothetical protein